MQDRYAGDIGDYIKLSLLRRLSAHRTIGVAWWLTANEFHNEDGRYTMYLDRPSEWRGFDSTVFDALAGVVASGRSVAALQKCDLVPNGRYAAQPLNLRRYAKCERTAQRALWFQSVQTVVSECDLVFMDPDNGIAGEGYVPCSPNSNKSITLAEIQALASGGRAVLIYHHQTRRAGGHLAEIDYLHGRLRRCEGLVPAGALRASPWSPRVFFLVNASEQDLQAIKGFARDWDHHCRWHQASELTCREN